MNALSEVAQAAKALLEREEERMRAELEGMEKEEEAVKGEFGMKAREWRGRVKLDVGGEVFHTTQSDLRSKGGLLEAMCMGLGDVQVDKEGCVFLDRSPLVFGFVMNHLCNEPLPLEKLSEQQRQMLEDEARFYELEELAELLGEELDEGEGRVEEPPSAVVEDASAARNSEDLLGRVKYFAELSGVFAHGMSRRRAKLVHQHQRYTRMLEKIRETHTTEKVKLQLRSDRHKCSTTLRTLTRLPGMLKGKFSGDLWRGDVDKESGSVFLGKDGMVFEHVLNVLRGGYSLPILNELEAEMFKNDLDYFGLTEAVAQMKPTPKSCAKWVWNSQGMGNLLQLSAGNLCVSKVSGTCHPQSTVLGSVQFKAGGQYFFKLEIRGLQGKLWVGCGITLQGVYDQSGATPYKQMHAWSSASEILPGVTLGGLTIQGGSDVYYLVDGKKQRLVALLADKIFQMPIKFPCWPCAHLHRTGNAITVSFDVPADIRKRLEEA